MLYYLRHHYLFFVDDFSACIGSFGHNCASPCPDGYYGHGCRLKCNCNISESCKSEIGCTIRYINGKLYKCF